MAVVVYTDVPSTGLYPASGTVTWGLYGVILTFSPTRLLMFWSCWHPFAYACFAYPRSDYFVCKLQAMMMLLHLWVFYWSCWVNMAHILAGQHLEHGVCSHGAMSFINLSLICKILITTQQYHKRRYTSVQIHWSKTKKKKNQNMDFVCFYVSWLWW